VNGLPRQRLDVWLFRARLAKTRAEAARLVSEGGVRIVRQGQSRAIDRPSATVAAGDTLVFARAGVLCGVEIIALGRRRGPPREARQLYVECSQNRD
jgi:ribosomal 50S subunit-recycling heat shock protein